MFKLGRLLSRTTDLLTIVGGLSIALMMIHITADVVMRALFGMPVPGTITIVSYYYMLIAAYIPLAFAEQKDAHISVEVVTERLPHAVQRHLAGWAYLLSAVMFALLTVRCWGEAVSKYAIGASVVQGETSIPVWPTYFFLPLGFGLMALLVFYKFILYLSGRDSGLDEKRAGPESHFNE